MNLLFLCSRNRLRSPTAEQMFALRDGFETASAGLDNDAETPLTPDLLDWADIIFVMEKTHRTKLAQKFRAYLRDKRIVCLDIPDIYRFMDPALMKLLDAKVSRHLPRR